MDVALSVTVDPCVEVRRADVERVVEIELRTKLVAPSPESTRAEVTCHGDVVELRVDDPITRKSLTRKVPIAALGSSAKSRLLALAVVELVSASWTELEIDKPPAVEPAGPPPDPTVRDSVRKVLRSRLPERPPRWRVSLVGGPGYDSTALGPSWGAGPRLRHVFDSSFGVMSDVVVESASEDGPRGNVTSRRASVAAFATWHHDFAERHRAEIGAGARGGFVQFVGSPIDPAVVEGRTLSSLWGGPELMLSWASRVVSPVFVEVTCTAGYATLPVHALADGKRVASFEGVWARPTIGVGAEF